MKFTHLHVHTHYSLLDGLIKVDDLVAKAKEDGMEALALTDHGVMHGAIEFYQKCKKAGIKPIIGVEAYLAEKGHLVKDSTNSRYHIILLAKNEQGYKNLIKLTTIANFKGFYYKPRIDWELLKEHSEGLICLSACIQGEIAQAVLKGKSDQEIEKVTLRYKDLFGEDNFYLEVQHHPNIPEQKKVNNKLFEIGKKLDVPLVATNDVHYLNTEDAEAHDILMCLQTKKKITDENRLSVLGEDFSFKTTQQMADHFRGNLEVIENTNKVAALCNLEIKLGEIQLPHYEIPGGKDAFEYLKEFCYDHIEFRYGFDPKKESLTEEEKKVIERLDYELSVIKKTGYASYFLITQDLINWSKDQGIIVGPGRGSAAGSLVAYLTKITNIDPLKYGLLFERFLNPDRISMPDIDTDFADVRRGDVLKYVEEKYGKDHVAQIITFGTMAARAAVRDVGRVLDMPYSFCDQISKLIPMGFGLADSVDKIQELKNLYTSNPDAKRIIDFARKLEGVARHASTHACGVVITKNPLNEYTPCQYNDESIVTQYSLKPIEDLGLLKMDFLGLRNLTIIENALNVIEKIHGDKINIDKIPLDLQSAYDLFQKGNTTGVFQFESSGMKKYLRKLKPTVFEDLIAMVSLYRPGPLNSGMIDEFIDRKHGRKKVVYDHPIMESALKNTYGVIVYQEQVMQLSKDMAGFTGGQADTLRKAMGKKIADLMAKMKVEFIKGCLDNKISKAIAERTFESMEKFAEYGFNKSHAACYALIAYQTAYLKALYPAEFMASLLTSDQDNMDRIALDIEECRNLGIKILPPDVNESFSTFTVVAESLKTDETRIRFGLKAVRNVGEAIVKAIIKERKENGLYENLESFLTRVNCKDLNKKSLEGLIKSGGLDIFGERNQLLGNIEKILTFLKEFEQEKNSNQANLFALAADSSLAKRTLNLIEVPVISSRQKLSWEKEFLGLYVTEHPFQVFADRLKGAVLSYKKLRDPKVKGQTVRLAGVISSMKKILTKKGDPMLFLKLEDNLYNVEVIVFPKLYEEKKDFWQEEKIIILEGQLSDKDDEPKILANKAWELREDNLPGLKMFLQQNVQDIYQEKVKSVYVNYPADATKDLSAKVKQVFTDYQGDDPVFLEVANKLIKTNFRLNYSDQVKQSLEKLLGENVVRFE